MGSNTDQRGKYGKPSALKEARSVWNGGKAVRPYLSLRKSEEEHGLSAPSLW
jgi:hypothetical protein